MPAIRARGDDLQRIALISAGQRGNRLWHGGREKERAAAIRRRVQYFFQFLTKTHVEHFVGFVENHGSQCACAKFSAFQMIAQTAWRTTDDMRPMRQLPLLIAYTHAPDNGKNTRISAERGKGKECVRPYRSR